MRFLKELTFEGTPEQVYELLTDQGFREQVAAGAGEGGSHSVSVTEGPDGRRSRVESRQPTTDFPAAARKVVGDTMTILQEEHWTSPTEARMDVTIPGKPGSVRGTFRLEPRGETTVQVVDAEIKVGVPIVGGKVEKLIGQIMGNLLKLQAKLANERLQA